MSFQFAHIETYSRKGSAKGGGSVSWVLAEARRDDGACPHVTDPGEPKHVYGCTINQLEAMHDELCQSVRYEVAGGRTRAVRQDQHTLFTVVCSYPVSTYEVFKSADESRRFEDWQARNIEWLKAEYGNDLKSVIMHDDEQFPHIHAYVLPDDLRCRNLHAGVAAKEVVMKAGPDRDEDSKSHNKRGDKAYRAAMSEWQDRYFEQVGLTSGLTRLGPGKRRLSREEWRAEQAAVKSVQLAQEQVRQLESVRAAYVARTKAQGEKYIFDTKAEAEKLRQRALTKADEAKRLHSAAIHKERVARSLVEQAGKVTVKAKLLDQRAKLTHQNAQKMMQKAQSEANRILSAARSQAEKVTTFGVKLRSFFTGFRINKIRDEILGEAKEEIAKIDNERREALTEKFKEQRKRQEVETRMHQALSRERDLKVKLSDAYVQIDELKPRSKGPARRTPKY